MADNHQRCILVLQQSADLFQNFYGSRLWFCGTDRKHSKVQRIRQADQKALFGLAHFNTRLAF